ncbi:MAG: FAD:protein FMN transferase [Planctomycetota bacterium]|jgi:thiamine biosynthesis lipoprotein
MNRRAVVLTAMIAVALGALLWSRGGPGRDGDRYLSFTDQIMASPISVMAPEPVAPEAAEIVFGIFRAVDERMSEWKAGSPLTAVNRAAGRQPVEVPDDLRAVIGRGIEIGHLTDGAFDITWAALWGLWDFKAEPPRVPDDDAIRARLALVDYRRIVIDDEAGTVYLPEEGMLVGLGGIAKGYALDLAAEALRQHGIDSFLISAAGQMMLGGTRGDRRWRVGIRDPRGAYADYFADLELTDVSVSSSGDYERYFIQDGVRYHHILDPRTGRPARGLRGATVIAADATLADALSTALVVLGTERALALVENLEGVEAVLVDAGGKPHVTSGLGGRLHLRHPPAPDEP